MKKAVRLRSPRTARKPAAARSVARPASSSPEPAATLPIVARDGAAPRRSAPQRPFALNWLAPAAWQAPLLDAAAALSIAAFFPGALLPRRRNP